MAHYTLNCLLCGAENDERETSTYCTHCSGVLTIRYQQASATIQYPLRDPIADPIRRMYTELRYLSKLSARYDCEIWAKLELQNPSGCFKDRGSYVEVLKAIELEADAICLASTGNMAASVAMYASYFELPCYVFVPESTSEAKTAQATMFNARILRIKGDFSTCEQLCKTFARSGNYYLAGDYVFREEGQKSFSFELIEQQTKDFDFIVIPVGCGTNFGAIHKGFVEARECGHTTHIPRLVAVQPEESSPVVEGIFKREKIIKKQVNTMATAVAAADPIDFHKVLKGIDETNGLAFTVTEDDILSSLKEMSVTEGIFTEPACALPLAAVKQYPEEFSGKRCLLVLTGTGLKDTGVVVRNALPSPALDNDIKQVMDFIASGYPQIQQDAFGKSRDTLLTQIKMDSSQQKIFENYLQKINKKGKSLSSKELSVLQSLVFNEIADLEYPVAVTDYEIHMKKSGLVKAKVTMDILGEPVKSSESGVGPFDSVLGAIKKQTDKHLRLELKNHEIEILSPGTNALVVVTLTLGYADTQIQSKAASPDVIEAGINAFIKGFAVVWNRERISPVG
jgi:threonine synthase